MPATTVTSKWVSGNLVFYDKSMNIIATWDGTNRKLTFPNGSTLEVDGVSIAGSTIADVNATAAEINMACDTSANTEVVVAANIITAAESGKTFFLNSAAEFISTLPAVAAGLKYTFIVTAAPAGASYTVVTNASANIIKLTCTNAEGVAGATDTDADVVTFVDGQAVAGDRLDVICDGTNWFAYGVTKVAAGMTSGTT